MPSRFSPSVPGEWHSHPIWTIARWLLEIQVTQNFFQGTDRSSWGHPIWLNFYAGRGMQRIEACIIVVWDGLWDLRLFLGLGMVWARDGDGWRGRWLRLPRWILSRGGLGVQRVFEWILVAYNFKAILMGEDWVGGVFKGIFPFLLFALPGNRNVIWGWVVCLVCLGLRWGLI